MKPLNVRVAEALGWTDLHEDGGRWSGYPPEWFDPVGGCLFEVPPWGENSQHGWKWTGPLIDRFKIRVAAGRQRADGWERLPKVWYGESNFDGWGNEFVWPPYDADSAFVPDGYASACQAVAEFICAAAEAGVLPK